MEVTKMGIGFEEIEGPKLRVEAHPGGWRLSVNLWVHDDGIEVKW